MSVLTAVAFPGLIKPGLVEELPFALLPVRGKNAAMSEREV